MESLPSQNPVNSQSTIMLERSVAVVWYEMKKYIVYSYILQYSFKLCIFFYLAHNEFVGDL